jgi:hypothetical protein
MEPPITTASNETGALVSRAPQPPNAVGFWMQIQPYVDRVPKLMPVVWSVFLLVGGGFFLLYYWSIGFMPELDLNTSITLLAVSAITGSVTLLMLGLTLLTPTGVWVHMIRTSPTLKGLWYAPDDKVAPGRALGWLVLPICGILGGILGGDLLWFDQKGWWWNALGGGVGGLLVSEGVAVWRLQRKLADLDCKQRWKTIGGFCASVFGQSLMFFLLSGLVVRPFIAASYSDMPNTPVIVMLTLGPFLIVFVDAAIALELAGITYRRLLGTIALGMSVVYLSVFLGIWTVIPNGIMYFYKFGHLRAASLILDKVGCAVVQDHEVSEKLVMAKKDETCQVSCVTIYSRLGSTYYVQADRPDHPVTCFTIPTQHVLSWAIERPQSPQQPDQQPPACPPAAILPHACKPIPYNNARK